MGKALACFTFCLGLLALKAAAQVRFNTYTDSFHAAGNIRVLPQKFYSRHTGFFCKKEDQLQKQTGLNLFFRLGTKAYVDGLERKRY